MTAQLTKLEQRLRRSGMLTGIGLVAELISLLWNHPTAFFLFLGVGVVLIVAGILYYFYSLVTASETPSETASPRTQDL
jgi:Ca2+/Na+ antiporter